MKILQYIVLVFTFFLAVHFTNYEVGPVGRGFVGLGSIGMGDIANAEQPRVFQLAAIKKVNTSTTTSTSTMPISTTTTTSPISTSTTAALAAPTNLAGTFNQGLTQLTLTWTNNAPAATGNKIQRGSDANFSQILGTATVAATATSYVTAAAITAGSSYYYRVQATQGTQTSPWTAVTATASATTPSTPPTTGTSPTTPSLATGQWEFAGWFGGGCFPNLITDPRNSGRLYLVSDINGLWRSDDKGENWRFITKGLTWAVGSAAAIAPSNSNVLYFSTEQGLFYSLDAGANWKAANKLSGAIVFYRPSSHKPIAVSTASEARVCVGTSQGKVYCSSDYGNNWQTITVNTTYFPAAQPVMAIAFINSDQNLLAATKSGLFRYSFSQGTWTPLITGKAVNDFAISAYSPSVIYAAAGSAVMSSRDGGGSWATSAAVPGGYAKRVALGEVNKDYAMVYAAWSNGSSGGIVKSSDNGASWVTKDTNMNRDAVNNPTRAWYPPGWDNVNEIVTDPFDYNIVYRTDWWGVWRSDDGAYNWYEKIKGAPNQDGTDLDFSPSGTLYATAMDNGLLKSADMGKTYRAIYPSTAAGADALAGHAWRVRAITDQKIVATMSPWNKAYSLVLVSNDGGATFAQVTAGLPTIRPSTNTMWDHGYPRALAVDPTNPNNIYLGIDGDGGGLFISTNGGTSWTRSAGQPGSLKIYNGLLVDPKDPNRILWAANDTNGGIYVSPDKGKTWARTYSLSTWILTLAAGQDGAIYAGTDQSGPSIFVSRDHGASWTKIVKFTPGSGGVGSIAVSPTNPKVLAASTGNWWGPPPQYIYLSRDGGSTWTSITGDLPTGDGAAAMKFSRDGLYLYISRYSGGIYRTKI